MVHSSDLEEESDISESEITDGVEKKSTLSCSQNTTRLRNQVLTNAPSVRPIKKTKISVCRYPSTCERHWYLDQALAKYMKHDLVDPKLALLIVAINPVPPHRKDEEKYVWPWKGILVNLPVKYKDDKYMGMTANEIKEMIAQFNPSEFPLMGL
jgi:XS domain